MKAYVTVNGKRKGRAKSVAIAVRNAFRYDRKGYKDVKVVIVDESHHSGDIAWLE